MSDLNLTAATSWPEVDIKLPDLSVNTLSGKALVSIANAEAEKDSLQKAMSDHYQCQYPEVGTSTFSSDEKGLFMALQLDQLFHLFDYEGDHAVETVRQKLGPNAYYTDQSDGWMMLHLSGLESRNVLARICQLDLHPDVFKKGSVARTLMQHISVIILCKARNSFILLTPRSFANSFIDMLKSVIQHCQDEWSEDG